MGVLTLNAGSSSLKAHLVEGERVVRWRTESWTPADHDTVLGAVLADVAADRTRIDVVAHRVVHGGDGFTSHAVIDDQAMSKIEAVGDLAPLHNAAAIDAVRAARRLLPSLPHVACFDTVFHATQSAVARREPVPEAWAEQGIRRYGFHGLSVEWSARRAAQLLERPERDLQIVVAHLGSGASVTAVDRGASAWTSMGYTPNDGIMMGTRSGALDPAIVTQLVGTRGMAVAAVADAMEHDSGLKGVSGLTGDVRELEAAAAAGDDRARLALELFAARAAAGIAAAASWLQRLDAVVFTGGIGEHAGPLRARIVARLAVLGAAPVSEDETGGDRILVGGSPAILRIAAREELVMARIATSLIGAKAADRPA